jgi:hypothetical protein
VRTRKAESAAGGCHSDTVEISVLGPIEVAGPDGLVQVGGPKERVVLAVLVAHAARLSAASGWSMRCGAIARVVPGGGGYPQIAGEYEMPVDCLPSTSEVAVSVRVGQAPPGLSRHLAALPRVSG